MSAISLKGWVIPENRQLRRVRWIRFLLPLLLFLLVVAFEVEEHWVATGELELKMVGEIVFFGVVGPSMVFLALSYIEWLLKEVIRASEEALSMNCKLEHTVAERTAALAARNAELAQANVELQQLDRMKSEFVSLVSHELRAPLTTMNGALEIALQNTDQIPLRLRHTLEVVAHETQRLTTLVQSILDVSRIEAGKLQVNFGPVAVRPLLQQAAEVMLAQSSRQVVWEMCSALPPVWADEILLEQVLRNLIRNADVYSPPGEPIYLKACLHEDGRMRIAVCDHGPGIPPEMQQRIFDRFARGAHGPRGWGLGLYLGRKLVELQQGAIGIVSPAWPDPDRPGSEFYILLPLASSPD